MSKAGGGCNSKRGGGKSKTGGGKQVVKKQRALTAQAESLIKLRASLFQEDGEVKDVLADFKPFQHYNRNGLDVQISFDTPKTMDRDTLKQCFELCKENMEDEYDESGYGWDDDDKKGELKDECDRYLVVRQTEGGELVGFVHFRFTLQGEFMDLPEGEPCLFVYDLQLDETVQRKGLGRRLMQIVELMARKQMMSFVMLMITATNEVMFSFAQKLKFFEDRAVRSLGDRASDRAATVEDEDTSFAIYSKCISKSLLQKAKEETEVQALAAQIAAAMASQPEAPKKKAAAASPRPEAASPAAKKAAAGAAVDEASPQKAQEEKKGLRKMQDLAAEKVAAAVGATP